MKILAIETSCDETGIAIVEGEIQGDALKASLLVFKTHKAALLSQAKLHAPYGGVYPNLAKREHQKNLPILFKEFEGESVDAIAVTQGPGLEPALWQGITFAQKLAEERGLPLLPVNHMEAHLISSLARFQGDTLKQGSQGVAFVLKDIKLPTLALLVSGGHTEFVLMREWFRYEVIGETLDDAVGECFDKVARLLGLPYPGGPHISALAESARKNAELTQKNAEIKHSGFGGSQRLVCEDLRDASKTWKLPRPMLRSGDCNVSFSGLKTAALYALRNKRLSKQEKAAFAAEFEKAVAEVFVAKTRRALEDTSAKTFVLGGGVAANRYLREQLQELVLEESASRRTEVEFRLPELSITGDNAIMIAMTALAHLLTSHWSLATSNQQNIRAIGNLSIAN